MSEAKKVVVVYNAKPGAEILVNLNKGEKFSKFQHGVPTEVDAEDAEYLLKGSFSKLENKGQEKATEGKAAEPQAEKAAVKSPAGKAKNFQKGSK